MRIPFLAATLALLVTSPALAANSVINVFGNDNPFLAGAPDGTACCGGDSAPTNSPALFTGFAPGSTLSFSATGTTDGAGFGPVGPEGASNFNMQNFSTGIAPAFGVGVNSLLGVFLTDAAPVPGAQPASLDFNGNRDFLSLAPGIAQIFFIGNGMTAGNVTQSFTAPGGATRLFFGVADGFGWFNNGGTLAVDITFTPAATGAVPEPASWAMMIVGFGLVGSAARRRANRPAISA